MFSFSKGNLPSYFSFLMAFSSARGSLDLLGPVTLNCFREEAYTLEARSVGGIGKL